MLQVDPLKRATVEEIKKHEWFQKDLPAYLFPSPVEHDSSVIDLYAVNEVCEKFGVKESEVHNALLSGDPHDQLAIAYHLVIDNKRIADEAAKAEIKDFYVAAGSPPAVSSIPPQSTHEKNDHSQQSHNATKVHPERIAPLRERVIANTQQFAGTEKRGTPVKRAKWHLGIRSQSKPNDIMLEVYRAMKALDFEWKIINPYHVRVRNADRSNEKNVKMSLQLYQVDAKSYLLDFKSLTNEEVEQGDDIIMESLTPPMGGSWCPQATGHHTMEFFEMCAALIIQLAR